MAITQEQARRELARRELARRELQKRSETKTKDNTDIIGSAASKITGIEQAPSNLERAISKTINYGKGAFNSALLGIPEMINKEAFAPRGLSPKESFEASMGGAVIPVGAALSQVAKILPKPLMTPKWIANISESAKSAIGKKLADLRGQYGSIFKSHEGVSIPKESLDFIPDFIKSKAGLVEKDTYSLNEVWKAREAMMDSIPKEFYKNKELFIKNKITPTEIKAAADRTKATVLNNLSTEGRNKFNELDAVYSILKNKGKTILKSDSKNIVNLYRDPLNARKILDIDEVAKIVPEVNKMKSDAISYIIRQRNKTVAKDVLLKTAAIGGIGSAVGYALSKKAR